MSDLEHVISVQTEYGQYDLIGRACEVSAFSFIPPERKEPYYTTYYGTPKKPHYSNSTYDRLFKQQLDYNNKLHRDDREHAKSRGLTVHDEESTKKVPTLASSEYGHRLGMHVDHPERKHVRIGHINSEFYRRNTVMEKAE